MSATIWIVVITATITLDDGSKKPFWHRSAVFNTEAECKSAAARIASNGAAYLRLTDVRAQCEPAVVGGIPELKKGTP